MEYLKRSTFIGSIILLTYFVDGLNGKIAVACENSVLSLDCGGYHGGVVKVSRANYGRTEASTCEGPFRTVSCRTWDAASHVKDVCQNAIKCSVLASNLIFGDPCPGTRKYLEVEYECVPVTDRIKTNACENENVIIECNSGATIKIINAVYGRESKAVCYKWAIRTTQCRAHNSQAVVSYACDGNRKCIVHAGNNIFGEPCHGTTKYLQVTYRCIQATTTTSTTTTTTTTTTTPKPTTTTTTSTTTTPKLASTTTSTTSTTTTPKPATTSEATTTSIPSTPKQSTTTAGTTTTSSTTIEIPTPARNKLEELSAYKIERSGPPDLTWIGGYESDEDAALNLLSSRRYRDVKPVPCFHRTDKHRCTSGYLFSLMIKYAFQVDPEDDNSIPSQITAKTYNQVLDAPTDLSVTNVTDSSLTLVWSPPKRRDGNIRRFLIIVSQVDDGGPGSCSRHYPMREMCVENETPTYSTEIKGLEGGSEYAVSVAGVTSWLGPAARIRASTKPPRLSWPPIPTISFSSPLNTTLNWTLHGESGARADFTSIKCNLLLLIGGDVAPPEAESMEVEDDVAHLREIIKGELDGAHYFVIADYDGTDVIIGGVGNEAAKVTKCGLVARPISFTPGASYRLAAVQVLQYKEVFDVAIAITNHFTTI